MIHGVWKVTGKRVYRGHQPGTEFEETLSASPAARAVARGDIQLLEQIVPAVPEEHALPEGWE